jgi:hypothetical protein
MSKAVFDHGKHGTNPNLFSGQFMDFDEQFYDDLDDGVTTTPNDWMSLENTLNYAMDPFFENNNSNEDEAIADYDWGGRDDDREAHFWELATEAGLDTRWYNMFDQDDREAIVDAWVKQTYIKYCDPDYVYTNQKQSTGGVTPTPDTCLQFGSNRQNRNTASWSVRDYKDHKIWASCRRGKGQQRAPKWQQGARSRRAATKSIRTLFLLDTPVFSLKEVLKTHFS